MTLISALSVVIIRGVVCSGRQTTESINPRPEFRSRLKGPSVDSSRSTHRVFLWSVSDGDQRKNRESDVED